MESMCIEYDPLAAKSEVWNSTSTDPGNVGVTLFEILEEVRSLREYVERKDDENKELLATLKHEIKELKTEVQELRKLQIDPEYKLLPSLPFETMTDLKEFDKKLPLDDEMRAELKIFIQKVGGIDFSSFLKAALRAVVTDELAIDLTWRGTPDKPSIQSFTLFVIIRDICHAKYNDSNLVEINRICQQHFLHAKDRFVKKQKNRISTPTFKSISCTANYLPTRIVKSDTPPPPPPSSPSSLLPTLPFVTLSDLEEFDDKLSDDIKLKKALKKFINNISSRDYSTFVRGAFKALMKDELATQLTWRGTKDKPSIQDFTIYVIIKDVCRAKYNGISNLEINKVCQRHFLHARDRIQKKVNK